MKTSKQYFGLKFSLHSIIFDEPELTYAIYSVSTHNKQMATKLAKSFVKWMKVLDIVLLYAGYFILYLYFIGI